MGGQSMRVELHMQDVLAGGVVGFKINVMKSNKTPLSSFTYKHAVFVSTSTVAAVPTTGIGVADTSD